MPAKYRKSAVRIDSSQFELSPEQQREAARARLALEKKAAAAAAPASAARPATAGVAARPRTAAQRSARASLPGWQLETARSASE